jgi:hypothetical protein
MERKTAISAVIIAVVLLAVFSLSSCSKRSVVDVQKPKKGKVGEEFVVQSNPDKEPKWTKDQEFEIKKENREKVIYVTAEVSQQKDKRAAERLAEAELRRKIAEGIETLVQSQFQDAMSGRSDSFREAFESYLVVVTENVSVVGLIVTDTYWEKIQRIKSLEEVDYYYRVLKRGKMPYENYVTARDQAWQDVLDRVTTEQERVELQRLIAEMKAWDEV